MKIVIARKYGKFVVGLLEENMFHTVNPCDSYLQAIGCAKNIALIRGERNVYETEHDIDDGWHKDNQLVVVS